MQSYKNLLYCSLFSIHKTDMSTIVIHRQPMLASIVAQLSNCSEIAFYARQIITKIVRSPINSKEGIKLSLDTPLNNPPF